MDSMKEKMKLYGYLMPTADEMTLPANKDKAMPRMVANQKAANQANQEFQ